MRVSSENWATKKLPFYLHPPSLHACGRPCRFSHSTCFPHHLFIPITLRRSVSNVLLYGPLTSNKSHSRNDNDRNMLGKIRWFSRNTHRCWCVCWFSGHTMIDGCFTAICLPGFWLSLAENEAVRIGWQHINRFFRLLKHTCPASKLRHTCTHRETFPMCSISHSDPLTTCLLLYDHIEGLYLKQKMSRLVCFVCHHLEKYLLCTALLVAQSFALSLNHYCCPHDRFLFWDHNEVIFKQWLKGLKIVANLKLGLNGQFHILTIRFLTRLGKCAWQMHFFPTIA